MSRVEHLSGVDTLKQNTDQVCLGVIVKVGLSLIDQQYRRNSERAGFEKGDEGNERLESVRPLTDIGDITVSVQLLDQHFEAASVHVEPDCHLALVPCLIENASKSVISAFKQGFSFSRVPGLDKRPHVVEVDASEREQLDDGGMYCAPLVWADLVRGLQEPVCFLEEDELGLATRHGVPDRVSWVFLHDEFADIVQEVGELGVAWLLPTRWGLPEPARQLWQRLSCFDCPLFTIG